MGRIKESLISLFSHTEDLTRLIAHCFDTPYMEGIAADCGSAIFVETYLTKKPASESKKSASISGYYAKRIPSNCRKPTRHIISRKESMETESTVPSRSSIRPCPPPDNPCSRGKILCGKTPLWKILLWRPVPFFGKRSAHALLPRSRILREMPVLYLPVLPSAKIAAYGHMFCRHKLKTRKNCTEMGASMKLSYFELLSPEPVSIPEIGGILSPKLRDISLLGYPAYQNYLAVLLMDTAEYFTMAGYSEQYRSLSEEEKAQIDLFGLLTANEQTLALLQDMLNFLSAKMSYIPRSIRGSPCKTAAKQSVGSPKTIIPKYAA